MNKWIIAACIAAAVVVEARAATYEVDASHSDIGFGVRHMVVSTVRGSFGDYSGSFEYNPDDLGSFRASAVIKTAGIDTRNTRRDDHLRNEDFFDAAKFPEITFNSTRVEPSGEGLVLYGDLTMKGVSREIALPITLHGPVTDPWGKVRAGFEGSVVVNRQDWGISWSKTMDQGGLVVDDKVTISVSIEGVEKKDEAAE